MAQHSMVEDISSPDYSAVIVEDTDGFRILQISGEPILPIRVWQRAYDAGVAMIVLNETEAVSTPDFVSGRVERPEISSYQLGPLKTLPSGAAFRDYIEVEQAEEDSDPLETSRFVHLHTHTEFSTLDGLSTVEEAVKAVQADPHGGGALGSADHGNCAVHPDLQMACDKYGIKPIFGMEAYFVPDRHRRADSWVELDGVRVDPEHLSDAEKKKVEKKGDSAEVKNEYTHLTLWAVDQVGLRNLWAMSTEAYRDGLYDGKPRLDWETLERLNEGVVCGTGCLRGPVSRPLHQSFEQNVKEFLDGKEVDREFSEDAVDAARNNLLRLHGIFGDRLYLEIHTNQLDSQVMINRLMVQWCKDYSIPPLACVDSHYSVPEHKKVHQAWLAMQTGKTLEEDTSLFAGGQDYHLKTADEVAESLLKQGLPEDFIWEAMSNTVEVARQCTAKVGGEVITPTYSRPSKEHPDPVQRDIERLTDICLSNWERKVVGKVRSEAEYVARLEREMDLLKRKGFVGYFLVVWDYVDWAKQQGCLVGPSRGSGGGSLVAYLADIVEIDPVDADLIFERFLTEGRVSLPDFDIDFPTSWRTRIINYIKERWGEDYVANIGTISRLRTKAAINDSVRVLKPVLPYEVSFKDFDLLKKAVQAADASLAGKHLPWEEFKAQHADIVDPMIEAYPDIFEVVDVVMDRVKTYGKHAAGVVISTGDPLTDLPMRLAKDTSTGTEVLVTQFDMNALERLGYVKFDFLTLRTLDTLQATIDLIAERFGVRINPYDWKQEYDDPQVWDEVCEGRTLGLFQIETASGTRLTTRMRPQNVLDLAVVMTIVRPGPMRSGLTESYLRRRAGLEPVTYLDERLEPILGDTYGAPIFQEQILSIFMNLADYNSTEADDVRKILGKKQVEKVQVAGEEFVRRAVECNTQKDVAEALWAQIAEFAKYGFGKAHAFGYAVLGQWCAFLRFHYPVEFLVAALSTVDADRIPEFIEDCRSSGYGIVPPDINRSEVEFSSEGVDIVYGLNMVKGIGEEPAQQIVDMRPYSSLDDFVERCVKFSGSKVNMGSLKTLVKVGAFDTLIPNRRAVEIQLEREATGESKKCVYKIEAPNPAHPFSVPCSYDWDAEPDPPMLRKRDPETKKMGNVPKPPPKKCTVSCRRYQPPQPVEAGDVPPYTTEEIMFRERELLGTWITHSPFESFDLEGPMSEGLIHTAQQIESYPAGTSWIGVCMVEEVKTRRDRNGNIYAFVKMNLQDGVIEAICFSSIWERASHFVQTDALGVVQINKTPRGYQLQQFEPASTPSIAS